MSEVKEIELEKIILSKTNPRKEFNKNSLQELADSIKTSGLVNPVTVRKKGSNFELVTGERRLRAAKLLKYKSILCIIRELTDEQVLEIQYIENLQRQDIHPLDEATFIQGMLESGRFTIDSIAAKIGKSISYVSSRYRLIWLIKDAHRLYAEGKIELGHALLIAKMQEDAQQKLLKFISQSFRVPTVSELRVQVAGLMPNLNEAPFNRKDKLLLPDAGSCVECKKRTGNAVDLFSEFSGNNICTDGSCYKEKVNLYMAMQIDKADEAGAPLIRISGVNYNSKKNVLGQSDYSITKKAAGKDVQKAIYTDGHNKGKSISIVLKPKEGSKEEKKELTDEQKLEQLNEQIKERRNYCFYEKITQEILSRDLKELLLPALMKLLINGLDPQFAHFIDIGVYKGWFEKKEKYDFDVINILKDIFDEQVNKLDYAGKIELLNQSFVIGNDDGPNEEKLIELAKYFSINTTEIKKKIEYEFPLFKKLPEENVEPNLA